MEVRRWDFDSDGPLTETALRARLEAAGYRVTRYVYPPGTRFDWHSHVRDKQDAVMSGRLRIAFESGECLLEPGDTVAVPAGVRHAAEVVGSESVVSLDAEKR